MIRSNIDNGFSKRSYLRIEKAESSKHCIKMEIVIVMGMKFIYLVVYVNYYYPVYYRVIKRNLLYVFSGRKT